MAANLDRPLQMSQADARDMFDYRDGHLWWKHPGLGRQRRKPAGGVLRPHPYWSISIGSAGERRHYYEQCLVWNWHHGPAVGRVTWRDGNSLNNAIENLVDIGRRTRRRSAAAAVEHVPVEHERSRSTALDDESILPGEVVAGGDRGNRPSHGVVGVRLAGSGRAGLRPVPEIDLEMLGSVVHADRGAPLIIIDALGGERRARSERSSSESENFHHG